MPMDLPIPETPTDPAAQARSDGRRFWRAALASAAFVALLGWIRLLEGWLGHSLHALAVHPQELHGLVEDMIKLLDKPVHLEVYIKVRKGWSDRESALRELGYE